MLYGTLSGEQSTQLFPGLAEEPSCIENPQPTKESFLQLVAAKAEKQNNVGDSSKSSVFTAEGMRQDGGRMMVL